MLMAPPATSLAADSNSGNVLAGLQFEFQPQGTARIIVRASGSAVGLVLTFLWGGINLAQRVTIPPTNRFPIVPDDVLLDFGVAGAGQRLFCDFDNTTAGALTWNLAIDLL